MILRNSRENSVTEYILEGIIVIDPVIDVYYAEFFFVIANYDVFDSRVDNKALAHAAAASVFNVIAGIAFFAHKIKSGIYHVFSRGADYGVCLRMDASAKFISFATGNAEFFSPWSAGWLLAQRV